MSDSVPGLHLVLGDEELLVERAVAAVLRAARKQAGTDDVPVNRMRAGEVSTSELAELLSKGTYICERTDVDCGDAGDFDCTACRLKWLRAPAEEVRHDN